MSASRHILAAQETLAAGCLPSCPPRLPWHQAGTQRPCSLLPQLALPPTGTTSSPDVYTGQPGPLPAGDRPSKHPRPHSSSLPLPTDPPPPGPASAPLQSLCLQILPTNCVWHWLCPATTRQATLRQFQLSPEQGQRERGSGSCAGLDRSLCFSEARLPQLQKGDDRDREEPVGWHEEGTKHSAWLVEGAEKISS